MSAFEIRTRQTRLRVLIDGDGPEDLLVVGGVAEGADAWHGQASALGDQYRVIRYDARGLGPSPRPRASSSLDQHVLDALEVLDSVGSQRAHVVGSSFGSAIAQWLAIDHAKRVATLTLSGAYARPDQHFEALADRWSEVASRATNPGELLASINVDAYGPESQEGGYAAERAEDGAQLLAGDIEAWEDFRGATITALAAALEHNSTRHLFRIDVPVLIVVGEHDAVLPLRHSEELAELIPQAQLALVPDAGHQVLEERRAEFNERLEAFLEQSRATAVATA